MSEWDAATFQQFVSNVLTQFESHSVQLILGEQSSSYFTEKFQKQLQDDFPGMTISATVIPNKAGFIVAVGGVDYNFFFDQMVDEIKRDFSPKLAGLAFQTPGEE